MADERPPAPFIADMIEASLALGWTVIFVVGVLLAAFVSPVFYIVVVVAIATDWLMLRKRVAKRLQIRPEDRKMLRLWTSYRGTYQAIRYLAGRR